MALFRVLTRSAVGHGLLPQCKIASTSGLRCASFTIKNVEVNNSKPQTGENFETKNKRLNRPLSPHLTIYKVQATSFLSISHRITGMALSGVIYGLAAGTLILPGSFPYYLAMVEGLHAGPVIIFGAKFLLAFPFTYHALNGIRHFNWDAGNSLTIKGVYATGYAVVVLSVLSALYLASL